MAARLGGRQRTRKQLLCCPHTDIIQMSSPSHLTWLFACRTCKAEVVIDSAEVVRDPWVRCDDNYIHAVVRKRLPERVVGRKYSV